MHNLFLNNIHNHVRYIWNMDESSRPYKNMDAHSKEEQQTWIDYVAAELRSAKPSSKNLDKARRMYLEAFVRLNFVHVSGANATKATKAVLIEGLIRWRNSNKTIQLILPKPHPVPIYRLPLPGDKEVTLNAATLLAIRNHIAETTMPSWIVRPPLNFGLKRFGKLNADQWRMVCTVSLVITLVHLWGGNDVGDKYRVSGRLRAPGDKASSL
ncbi:hypothetical protein BKA70DRAFT_1452159 [Coprinopsis sp. MPI-PUGE-AT-0042]|nr:hypothetical protein BKA70DRAFT_1452159 [Coprinopsis sp. MPI-PUGE-AT-0042]